MDYGDWPAAFGIPKQTNDLAYYKALAANRNTRSASRPSAFVGWQVVVGGSDLWGTTTTYAAFRSNWIGLWGNTFDAPSISDSLVSANASAHWIDPILLKNSIRVYGYTALKFRDYNRKSDWPSP